MKKNSGFIALLSVMIIAAVALTIGIGMLLRSIGESSMAVTNETTQRAHAAATACAEKALQNLKNSNSYPGNETLIVGIGDTCHISAIAGNGNTNRSFSTTSTISDETFGMTINITSINPTMQISSWQDVIN